MNHKNKLAVKDKKSFSQLILYIIIINISLFTTSVILHELGHLVLASDQCTNARIVIGDFSKENTVLGIQSAAAYTEMSCPDSVNKAYLGFTGLPFVLLFGLAFLLLNIPEKNFGFVLIGLSFMLAGLDMTMIVNNALITPIMTLLGVFFIVFGEIRFIDNHIIIDK